MNRPVAQAGFSGLGGWFSFLGPKILGRLPNTRAESRSFSKDGRVWMSLFLRAFYCSSSVSGLQAVIVIGSPRRW